MHLRPAMTLSLVALALALATACGAAQNGAGDASHKEDPSAHFARFQSL